MNELTRLSLKRKTATVQTISDIKAKLYKTAKARIGCAEFNANDCVAVQYSHTDDKGQHWFLCKNHSQKPYIAIYPQKHLTDFVL